jgi:hypothetical protein
VDDNTNARGSGATVRTAIGCWAAAAPANDATTSARLDAEVGRPDAARIRVEGITQVTDELLAPECIVGI